MEYSSIKPGDRKRSLDNPGNFAISAAPSGGDKSWTKASERPEVDDYLARRASDPSYSVRDLLGKIGAAIEEEWLINAMEANHSMERTRDVRRIGCVVV
jgi:hypothetical protein